MLLRMEAPGLTAIQFPLAKFGILIVALLPLITLFAAILLSISTFSRNMKEARSYESPLILIAMMVSMVSYLPGFDLNNSMSLIPIVNIALLFKETLVGQMQISHFLITVGSTLVLDAIAIFFTIRLFNSEAVLFRTEGEGTSLKSLFSNTKTFFTPYIGLLYYVAALAAFYYLGIGWQSKDLVNGLVQTQFLLVFLPVFLLLRIFKLNQKEALRLKPSKVTNYLLVLLMAVPVFILSTMVAQLINAIFPFPKEYVQSMNGLIKIGNFSIFKVLLLIAVLPAICEETMFRGFIMRFYESYGKWTAIIITAVLFGIFHLDIYRLLPVTLLGIWLGYLVQQSGSLHLSMLAHFLNNSMAVVLGYMMERKMIPAFFVSGDNVNWWLALPALLILAGFVYIFQKQNRTDYPVSEHQE
jgi:sodium transport system permease protein